MKSVRNYVLVILVILTSVSLFPLNIYAQVRSTPVTVVNEPTVAIDPAANVVKLATDTPSSNLNLSVVIPPGVLNTTSTPYATGTCQRNILWSASCESGGTSQTKAEFQLIVQITRPNSQHVIDLYLPLVHQLRYNSPLDPNIQSEVFVSTMQTSITLPAGTNIVLIAQRGPDESGGGFCGLEFTGDMCN